MLLIPFVNRCLRCIQRLGIPEAAISAIRGAVSVWMPPIPIDPAPRRNRLRIILNAEPTIRRNAHRSSPPAGDPLLTTHLDGF